ncbi:hypothetical protein G4B11_010295 [Aspergillus flavus]|nr:hypothetical protein G4B11_010295 [Aspergillus flavus]
MAERTGEVRAGFVVAVEQEAKRDGHPTVFNAKQIPTVNSLPIAPPDDSQAVHEIVGYIDTSTLEVGIRLEVFGAHILNLFGNLNDGVVGRIDLFLAKGEPFNLNAMLLDIVWACYGTDAQQTMSNYGEYKNAILSL